MNFEAFMILCMALPILITAPLFLWIYNLEVKVAELKEEEITRTTKSILYFGYVCLALGLILAALFFIFAFG